MASTELGIALFDAAAASLQDQEGIGESTDLGLKPAEYEVMDAAIAGQIRLCEAPLSDNMRHYRRAAETDVNVMVRREDGPQPLVDGMAEIRRVQNHANPGNLGGYLSIYLSS